MEPVASEFVTSSADPERFDASYYRKYYGSNPVHTRRQIASLASGVYGFATWWRLGIHSVLDIGAGPGYWRDWFKEQHPRVRYQSVDVSAHACKKYGHDLHDITEWTPKKPADLVVCQGVLHYLDAKSAAKAIDNVIAATNKLLYLEAPTSEDRRDVLDLEVSDLHAQWRPAQWYRRRLEVAFVQAGAGLWIRKGEVNLYCLEGN